MECPKCKHIQEPSSECIACGIIFEKYNPKMVKKKMDHDRLVNPVKKNHTHLWGIIVAAVFIVLVSCLGVNYWLTPSDNGPSSLNTYETDDVYDASEPEYVVNDPMIFNLAKQINDKSTASNPLELAMNATVTVQSPWATGYGFFISDRGHILTSKRIVSYEKKKKNPVWKKKRHLNLKIEHIKKNIENLERKLSYERLTKRELQDTENELKKKNDAIQEAEDQLLFLDSDIKVTAIDGTELEIRYINQSDYYDVALLIVEDIKSPFIKPVMTWPTDSYFQNLLNNHEKVYVLGNAPQKKLSICRSLFFKFNKNEKCCHLLQTMDSLDFFAVGSPLLNQKGEVLGLCDLKQYRGKAIPILSILEEFDTIIDSAF